jgi:hypothetical protein
LRFSSRNVALVAIFGALYYVLSLILPALYAIGVPNLQISLTALIASVFGMVLGPYLGALSALLGVLMTWGLPPSSLNPYGVPFLLSPPLNAFVVGLIFYRKWKWGFAIFGLLIIAFLFTPPAQPVADYYYVSIAVLWDKIIALLLIIPAANLSSRLSSPRGLPILFFMICFVGNQVDNTWGTDVFALPSVYTLFGFPTVDAVRETFVLSPFFYPAIRLVQALIATIVAVPLIRSLKDTKWILNEKSIIEQ